VPALHINGGGAPTREDAERDCLSAVAFALEGDPRDYDADASDMWPGRVVTKISEAGPFWGAETEDQNYLQHYPTARISSARSCPGHVAAPVIAIQ
jgi:hypothetical protein